jgi:hypothetical protein
MQLSLGADRCPIAGFLRWLCVECEPIASLAPMKAVRHMTPTNIFAVFGSAIRSDCGQVNVHCDDSLMTMNFSIETTPDLRGGQVVFVDSDDAELCHRAGSVAVHPGNARHMAHPVAAGKRLNIIVWWKQEQADQRAAASSSSSAS